MSRREALATGELIDCTELASEAGFRWPCAIHRAVWEDCVSGHTDEDEQDDRVSNILRAASNQVAKERVCTNVLTFTCECLRDAGTGAWTYLPTQLRLYGHWDDNREPCLTVSYPRGEAA